MNRRAQTLADNFVEINSSIIAFVEGCSDAEWHTPCLDDGRTVGVIAHHIASSHTPIESLITMVATGAPIPEITMEMLHAGNAQHAAEHARCTQVEVLALLRHNGADAAETVRALDDAQLARSAYIGLFDATMSTGQVVENVLIGHAHGHFAKITSTVMN